MCTRDAGQQGRAAADGVGERADQQLAERQADQGAGEGELHRRGGGLQVVGDRRQRRQVHVDGERPERDEETEHEHEGRNRRPSREQVAGRRPRAGSGW